MLEDIYNFEDALVVGGLLISLLKNSDRVKMACLAQLVNVIAPIMTETGGKAWKQTIYYPFYYTSLYGRGTALKVNMDCPRYDCRQYTDVTVLDAVAVADEGEGTVTLFVLNRSMEEDIALSCDLRSVKAESCLCHTALEGYGYEEANSALEPDRVAPSPKPTDILAQGRLEVVIPRSSWHMFRFRTKG